MTDRHLHCVYFMYRDTNNPSGYCLLKQKKVKWFFAECCKKKVLRPSVVLDYYICHTGADNTDYTDCGIKALEYLKKTKFNDYPEPEDEP